MRATFSETSVGERRRRRSLVLVSKGQQRKKIGPRWMAGWRTYKAASNWVSVDILRGLWGKAYHMLRALFLRLDIQDCDGD